LRLLAGCSFFQQFHGVTQVSTAKHLAAAWLTCAAASLNTSAKENITEGFGEATKTSRGRRRSGLRRHDHIGRKQRVFAHQKHLVASLDS
jgi:hypothetical protein